MQSEFYTVQVLKQMTLGRYAMGIESPVRYQDSTSILENPLLFYHIFFSL